MHSRKLASRMGLETGWNTAISLADDCVGERLEWENFAQLPHGIQQIRTHLETQDNVPLLVHLFTHSYSLSVASNRRTDDHMLKMLDVMTEWKEGVMTLSNSSHTANTQLFKKVASKRNRHLGSFLHHDEPVRPLFGDARLGACERRNAGIVLRCRFIESFLLKCIMHRQPCRALDRDEVTSGHLLVLHHGLSQQANLPCQ